MFATIKNFKLDLSKQDIYCESAWSVLLKSAKNCKKKVAVSYKANLKFIQYNVIGLCGSFATISIFWYYMTVRFGILYDTVVSNTIWYSSFGYYMTIHFGIKYYTKKEKINIIKNSIGIAYPYVCDYQKLQTRSF